MSRHLFHLAFGLGLAALAWIAAGFAASSPMALAMTAVIALAFLAGSRELQLYRRATDGLAAVLRETTPADDLGAWLARVPAALREPVRLRLDGARTGLPGPALTPYLVGLLVMLGMLGTFLGLVVTFRGTVFALEASADLQAIRAALAAPIRGLGLAFGTSVAGVAASALLGLMAAIARRERLEVARLLDARIAGPLQPHTLAHRRAQAWEALQRQADGLPAVVQKLDALLHGLEQRAQALDAQLLERHAKLQQDTAQAHAALAERVGGALERSLAAGARAAGDALAPVVAGAMDRVTGHAQALHGRLEENAAAQLRQLGAAFDASVQRAAAGWDAAQQAQARAAEAQAAATAQALGAAAEAFTARSEALVQALDARLAAAHAAQAASEQARLDTLAQGLREQAAGLQAGWQAAAEAALARQQAVCTALEQAAGEIAARTGAQATQALDGAVALVTRAEALVQDRLAAEARWAEGQAARMDELAGLWRSELAALRAEEQARGEAAVARLEALRADEQARGSAAVDRLATLEAAVAQHLATLGAALEAPLARLLQTAAEVPQAAADVIGQLRTQVGQLAERDNLALRERTDLLAQLGALLGSVQQATDGQRAAVQGLVDAAGQVMAQAGERFAALLQAQAAQAGEVATQAAATGVELAALAEGFGAGVQAFQAGSDRLLEGLQRLEAAVAASSARSDEQLAYYVAQAREVIDLSIASQQGLVEQLRQVQAAVPERA
jgi:hypothetical protein